MSLLRIMEGFESGMRKVPGGKYGRLHNRAVVIQR